MQRALLFLFGTVILTYANGSVVCRDDQTDNCNCTTQNLPDHTKSLKILCDTWSRVNLGNINVPDSLIVNVSEVKVILTNTGATWIPKSMLSSQLSKLVTYLEVSSNYHLGGIDREAFDNLPKLRELNLERNRMGNEILNSGWITSKLGKTLRKLNLHNNEIWKIPDGLLNNLSLLEDLDLSMNVFSKISDLNLKNLQQLKTLNLNYNGIINITNNDFGNLPQLTFLDLQMSIIERIAPGAFSKMPNLTSIILTKNRLTKITTAEVFANPNKLRALDLKYNLISEIPAHAFDKFDALIYLDLTFNQISKFYDSSLNGATNLRGLFLMNNNLTDLPVGGMKSLTKLDKLLLNYNSIKILRKGAFDGLKTLRKLILTTNAIEKIEDGAFNHLGALKLLDIRHNRKVIINEGTFGKDGPTDLRTLQLYGCGVKTLPINFFKYFPSITFVELGYNLLTSVPIELRNSKSLRMLSLSFNDITEIPANAFGHNPALQQVYVNNLDKLTTVSDCAFCGLTGLQYVVLNGTNNLKTMHENAFGFAKNTVDRTMNITYFELHDGGLKTVPHKLLPWDKIGISVLGNPANCDSRMDWLFRNKDYNIDTKPSPRYYDKSWCEQCKHDKVCQNIYGYKDSTTKSPHK